MEKPSAWSRLPQQLRSDADHGCEVEFVAGRRRPRRWRTPTVIDGIAPENQVRTGLPAGGRWIRTIGPRHERAGFCCGRRIAGPNGGSQKGLLLMRYRWFESISLQRRVSSELGSEPASVRLQPRVQQLPFLGAHRENAGCRLALHRVPWLDDICYQAVRVLAADHGLGMT